ncbi:MAG TPA: hypothetical protein ENK47_05765 [Euryarchaeota archaeon]|nr:hypothetical protein [Euryarchaeota archaeon]
MLNAEPGAAVIRTPPNIIVRAGSTPENEVVRATAGSRGSPACRTTIVPHTAAPDRAMEG